MASSLPALIFDLDGTLTDSKPGILGCLRKVLDERNMGDCGPLDRFIGPPVEDWVAELLPQGTEEERSALAHDYRACYGREGWSNNSVFPGVREMLADLHARGFPLYVCTSKVQHFAVRILDHFELSPFFTAIYGDKAEFDDHSKPQLLARLLAEHGLTRGNTSADSTSSQLVYMIGDRIYDIEAARANNIPCLAAGWGYGTSEEYAQADAIALMPADILSLVTPAARTAASEIASV